MMTLSDRRVVFVYEAARLAAIAAGAPIVPEPWEQRDEAFRLQMTDAVARQCGPMPMSAEEAHGAWVQAYIDMGWRYGPTRDPEAKTHPDMVPYAQLGQLERDKDEIYVALCRIAAQYIREEDT